MLPCLLQAGALFRSLAILLIARLLLQPLDALSQTGFSLAPLFQADEALPVRIEAPFAAIFNSRGDDAGYFPSTLYYTDADGAEVATALRIKTRGNFRNRESVCRFAPLMLNFPRRALDHTLCAGENRLKLVTHCQPRARYRQFVLLEYLAYRILNQLTAVSMKVRLLDITYV